MWTKIVEINIGKLDRWARVLVGLGLIVVALAVPTGWGWLGLYPLCTGLIRISPLYWLFGIRTSPEARVAKTPQPLPPMSPTDAG